jgi:hypothetical protein
VVTFVELGPEGAGPDDEPLTGSRRRRVPEWVTRVRKYRYLVLLAGLAGSLLAGDAAGVVHVTPAAPLRAGLVYADRGHCPISVDCAVVGRVRQDLWDNYNRLFDRAQAIGGNLWYASATGTVYYQELDAVEGSAVTITLTQQRISGPPVSFGPIVDLPPRPRRSALITARRGPWLLTAALSGPGGIGLPIMAAIRWTTTAPLPG